MNISKNFLIKNFSIGFLPILIFLIADLFYGPIIGIYIALGFGILELIYFYFKNKKVEKFILYDILLLLFFGFISLSFENALFFKLKPAVMQLVVVALLAVHGFTRLPVLLNMLKRYLPAMELPAAQRALLKKTVQILAVILFAHTLLIVYSAFYMSKEWWAFISGGLFYVIFALFLAGQWIFIKKKQRKESEKYKDEEWFDIVNADGHVLGKAPRSLIHGNPKLIHPVVHIHVFNKNGKLFLQQRSHKKERFAGFWDTAVGGHVSSGESVAAALLREAMEELGVDATKAVPLFKYVMHNEWESELIHTYKLVQNGPFKLCPIEMDDGRFWSAKEIDKNLGKGVFTPNFEEEYRALKKMQLI